MLQEVRSVVVIQIHQVIDLAILIIEGIRHLAIPLSLSGNLRVPLASQEAIPSPSEGSVRQALKIGAASGARFSDASAVSSFPAADFDVPFRDYAKETDGGKSTTWSAAAGLYEEHG